MRRRFSFVPEATTKETYKITTQPATLDVRYPLRRHFKSRYPGANVHRIHETFSTDTMFPTTKALGGFACCQLFVGNDSSFAHIYGMKKREGGRPSFTAVCDWLWSSISYQTWQFPDANIQGVDILWNEDFDQVLVHRAYHQHQNQAERRIQTIKRGSNFTW